MTADDLHDEEGEQRRGGDVARVVVIPGQEGSDEKEGDELARGSDEGLGGGVSLAGDGAMEGARHDSGRDLLQMRGGEHFVLVVQFNLPLVQILAQRHHCSTTSYSTRCVV